MTRRDAPDSPAAAPLSRRDFFAGAGMTAGAIAALGGLAGSAVAPVAQAAVRNRQYFSNFMAFELDGRFAGPVLNAEGGEPAITPGNPARGLPATVRYEPLQMVIGDMSAEVFDWIDKTSAGQAASRAAAVVAYRSDGKEIYRLNMQGARLTEIVTDAFDAADAQMLRFNVKVTATQSAHSLAGGTAYQSQAKLKANLLQRSNFRLYIQGLESIATRIRSIDKVGLQPRPDGSIGPKTLKFNLPFTDAAPVIQWMQDTLAGKTTPRPGELQMLSRDLTKVAARVTFEQLTVTRVGCPLEASNEKVQLVDVECEAASLKFDMGDLRT